MLGNHAVRRNNPVPDSRKEESKLSDQFYIRVRGRVQGPFDSEKLRQLARRGQFSRMHEISVDGQQWEPAKERPELFAAPAVAISAPASRADSFGASAVQTNDDAQRSQE